MLQVPRWKVDVTVGNDLVKTIYETASTSKAAIAKAKHKLRGAVSSAGKFKFKATRVAETESQHATTKKRSPAQLDREIEAALSRNPARKAHATKTTADVSVGDEVYAISGGRRHGPGIVEEIYSDGSMRVDFTRQFAGRLRVWPADLIAVPSSTRSRSRTHATAKTAPRDWTARQMTSGRRVMEKARGNKIARIFQGEGHWTVTINQREPREPFETTGEITRKSAKTLPAAKSLGTRLLKA